MDKLKSMAASAGQAAQQAGQKASSAAATFSHKAAEAAQKAAADAQYAAKEVKKSAAHMTAGSGSMIGQTVVIKGRSLYIDALLAEGGFGSVYSAIIVETDQAKRPAPGAQEKVVLKRMLAGNKDLAMQLVNEVKLMTRLVHPNIVKVLGAESRPQGPESLEIMLVMELCPGGHLLTRLNGLKDAKRILPWTKILEVFVQIVRPVAAMHALEPPTAHRDLKFENVLIAGDGTLRLCDFGSASAHAGVISDKFDRAAQEDAILRYTTPHFRSPEMVDLFSGLPLDVRSDVWALGCMLYGLAYYGHPFQEAGNLAIMAARYKLPTHPPYPAPIHTLIRACLQYAPDDRPTAAQVAEYVDACVGVGSDAGPFPPLHLSGGDQVQSCVVHPPPSGSDMALPDGGVMITGSKAEISTGGTAGGAQPKGYHAPTAQDILQQVQAQALSGAAAASAGGAKSSALAARLAKKGGGGPLPASATAPTGRPSAASSGSEGFETFEVPAPSPAPAPPHLAPIPPPSYTAPAPAAGSGFEFDFFGGGGAGTVAGTDAGPRPASGGGMGIDLSPPAPVESKQGGDLDDFFSSSSSTAAKRPVGGDDMLGFGSSMPSARSVPAATSVAGLEDAFGSSFGFGQAGKGGAAAAPQRMVSVQAPAPANSGLDDIFNF